MEPIKFSIKSHPKQVSTACIILRNSLDSINISKTTLDKVELSLAEALNNIIEHAYQENYNYPIDIEVRKKHKTLEIKLEDYGLPRKNLKKPVIEFDPDDIQNLPEGGFGLFLIETMMDENTYKYVEGKNIFIMKKILN